MLPVAYTLYTKQIFDQISSAVDDVWSARNDPKLWKSLDSAFKTFLANKPSPSASQVLLSILWTTQKKLDHRVDPSLILIQIIVTSRTAHQFILQNLCYIMCSNTRTCYPLKLVITTWNKNIRMYWITLAYFTHGKWMHERTIALYDVSWKMTCDEQTRNT